RDVVVEAGQREVVPGEQPHSGEDGNRGPGRKGAGGPRHRFGENIAFNLDLHRKLPPVVPDSGLESLVNDREVVVIGSVDSGDIPGRRRSPAWFSSTPGCG